MGEELANFHQTADNIKKLASFATIAAQADTKDGEQIATKYVLLDLLISGFFVESQSMEEEQGILGNLEMGSTTKECSKDVKPNMVKEIVKKLD